MKSIATLLALMCTAGAASAATVSVSGLGGAIPPSGSGGSGTPSDNLTTSLTVVDDLAITGVSVILHDFTHTWAGDLVVTLTHVDSGASATLFERIGRVTSGFGDSSNFSGTYMFHDAAAGDLWGAALLAANSDAIIPGGEYQPSGFENAAASLAVFAGLSSASEWRLSITDMAAGDTGTLRMWELSLDGERLVALPTPLGASFAGAGLLAVGGLRRRR